MFSKTCEYAIRATLYISQKSVDWEQGGHQGNCQGHQRTGTFYGQNITGSEPQRDRTVCKGA